MPDELARWAAERGPELLARAEAEAVAVLRAALVRAALGEGAPEEPRRPQPDEGELLWAYCVLRAGDAYPPDMAGVEPSTSIRGIEVGQLTVLASGVPHAGYAEEPLRRNLNDLQWLERVARAHEAVLERTLEVTTIVPLRLCTLFDSEANLRAMLERERDALLTALAALDGRQEWGVKLLADRVRLDEEARVRSEESDALENELDSRSEGGAYMLRRRLERQVREQADVLAAEIADDVHGRLQEWAVDAVTRPPQNRELSGHEGEMLLNAAYLIEADRIDELRELVTELEARHRGAGVQIEMTGPWPPYNFVPADGTAIS